MLSWWLTSGQSPSVRLFLLSNLKRRQNSPFLKFHIPIDILANALDDLGGFPVEEVGDVQFKKPVLVIRAMQSHYIPNYALPVIQHYFPHARVVEIDCGHWVITEKPEEARRGLYFYELGVRGPMPANTSLPAMYEFLQENNDSRYEVGGAEIL